MWVAGTRAGRTEVVFLRLLVAMFVGCPGGYFHHFGLVLGCSWPASCLWRKIDSECLVGS